MSSPVRIMISAGEASGDRLGAGLARAILKLRPDVDLVGMGGPKMAAAGVRLVQDAADVAVVGFVEVLAHLKEIRSAMGKLRNLISVEKPDLFVPIDFPDFNLRLARDARRADVPVVYFVSPQVWAWRRGRVRKIGRLIRRMLVLFPFEKAFYEDAGVPVTFVGHPVVERIDDRRPRLDLLERAGFDTSRQVVALLPGSRTGEVNRLFPILLEAAGRLRLARPDLQFLVCRAGTLDRELLQGHVASSGLDDVIVHEGDFPEILTGCAAGAVTSGTATLESAMALLPMVVVYRMSGLSYALGRLLVRVEHVGMVNLVAGRRIVPELVQNDCTPAAVADILESYLAEPDRVRSVRKALSEVRNGLGGPGAFERAARAVLDEVENS